MLAKFPGRCTRCQAPIRAGDEIVGAGSDATGWVHTDCRDDLALPGLTTPQPTKSIAPHGRTAGKARASRPAMVAPEGATFVYTDGACSGNPGPGGWAWAIDRDHFASGSERPSTNQRMEIRAALEAVRALAGPLVVVSDSTYVVNCFRDRWWDGWLERGWTTRRRSRWRTATCGSRCLAVKERGDVAFRWVKGHSGHEMNDLVDRLAVAASLGRE